MRLARRALGWTIMGVAGLGASLSGCQSFDEATGSAKIIPDEFAVVTKAPLIVPPDFNLRPPRPGSPEANAQSPEDEARQTLYQTPQQAADALGPNYSDGEKMLLTHSGGSTVDPGVRRTLSQETGYETDQGVTNQLLAGGVTPAPPPAPGLTAPVSAAKPAATSSSTASGQAGYETDPNLTNQLLGGAATPSPPRAPSLAAPAPAASAPAAPVAPPPAKPAATTSNTAPANTAAGQSGYETDPNLTNQLLNGAGAAPASNTAAPKPNTTDIGIRPSQ